MAGTVSFAELQLRIGYHRWGGVAGWTKSNIRLSSVSWDMGRGFSLAELGNRAELDQLGLELWLNWSLEDFPGWGGVAGVWKS